jgi:preprotein translocase subunit SecG
MGMYLGRPSGESRPTDDLGVMSGIAPAEKPAAATPPASGDVPQPAATPAASGDKPAASGDKPAAPPAEKPAADKDQPAGDQPKADGKDGK